MAHHQRHHRRAYQAVRRRIGAQHRDHRGERQIERQPPEFEFTQKISMAFHRRGAGTRGVARIEGMRIPALALLALLSLPVAAQPPVELKVVATNAARPLSHVRLSMHPQPGAMTLLYPEWIP